MRHSRRMLLAMATAMLGTGAVWAQPYEAPSAGQLPPISEEEIQYEGSDIYEGQGVQQVEQNEVERRGSVWPYSFSDEGDDPEVPPPESETDEIPPSASEIPSLSEQILMSEAEDAEGMQRYVTSYDGDRCYLSKPEDKIRFNVWAAPIFRAFNHSSIGINEFAIRRARFDVRGVLDEQWSYFLGMNFSGQFASLWETWLEFRRWPAARIRMGQFKEPFSYEQLLSIAWMPFIERALGPRNLAPGRDIGLQLFGASWNHTVTYAAGIFNGSGPNMTDFSTDKEAAGRLVFTPFYTTDITMLKDFSVGGSFTTAMKAHSLAGKTYLTEADTPFITFEKGVRQQGRHQRWGGELEWIIRWWKLYGEYIWDKRDNVMKIPKMPEGMGAGLPTGMPSGLPTGLAALIPPGGIPPGMMPPGGLPPGGFPTAMPPGGLPPGGIPPGMMPPGGLPPGGFPTGMTPPGGTTPRPGMPGLPPGMSLPPGLDPSQFRLRTADIVSRTWYAAMLVVLTGEDEVRDGPIAPRNPFMLNACPRGWGAWELGARYEQFRTNERPFEEDILKGSSIVDAWTLGLNWYPTVHIRFQANVYHADFNKELSFLTPDRLFDKETAYIFLCQYYY